MKSTWFSITVICVVLVVSFLQAPVAMGQDAQGSFTIARLVVSEGVIDREPSGVGEVFSLSLGKVYCFLEAKDIDADTDVHFVWYHEGIQRADVPLVVRKGSRWRTFASKKLGNWKGAWKVELQDAEGTVLKTVDFSVE